MKGKPLIPFFVIAVAGLLLMLSLSFVGLNQQADEGAEENGEESVEDMDPVEYGEEVVSTNCVSCHGDNLEGSGSNPAIIDAAEKYSKEEIADIAKNGTGGMPAGMANGEEAEAIAEYLHSLSE